MNEHEKENELEKDEQPLGFNNREDLIIEIGEDEGEVDYTVRPLRESLRKLIRPEDRPPSSENGQGTP